MQQQEKITILPEQPWEDELSPRQHEVLQLVLRGYSEKELSEALLVSVKTIKWHVTGIYKISGYRTRSKLMASYIPKKEIFLKKRGITISREDTTTLPFGI